jgi:hypothetical protein
MRINNARTDMTQANAIIGMNRIINGNGFLTPKGALVARKACRRYNVSTIIFDVS